MQEVKHEEGTDILDPEMKKKQEELEAKQKLKLESMRSANKAIDEALKTLSEEHGMKFYVAGYSEEYKEMGIWKSENVEMIHEMAFCKLIETQF